MLNCPHQWEASLQPEWKQREVPFLWGKKMESRRKNCMRATWFLEPYWKFCEPLQKKWEDKLGLPQTVQHFSSSHGEPEVIPKIFPHCRQHRIFFSKYFLEVYFKFHMFFHQTFMSSPFAFIFNSLLAITRKALLLVCFYPPLNTSNLFQRAAW